MLHETVSVRVLRHSSPGVLYYFATMRGAPAVRFRPDSDQPPSSDLRSVHERTTANVTLYAKSGIRPAAASTHTEDCEVPDVDCEAMIGGDSANRRFENSRGYFGYSPALPTNEM